MNYSSYNPSYTLHPPPSPSELVITRSTPSPPPIHSSSLHSFLPPLPVPASSLYNNTSTPNNTHHSHLQRHQYPTSSPYQQQHHQSTPDLSAKSRHPTSSFTNGYASPATSSYSSEPASRDEIELMDPGSLGGSTFHGHANLPGIDGIISRGDGIYLDHPRNESRLKRWNMRDFNLVQTVGISLQYPQVNK
jgi:hypothetical protein